MRETRHLWIGNLAENIREDRIAEHFKRYGKIDKVRFLPKRGGDAGLCACVAFMDIRSAQKAKAAVNTIADRELVTDYFDPSRGTPSTAEEGPRLAQSQPQAHRSIGNRRYESHRESSGGDDRFSRDRQPSYDRNFQQGDVAGAENYDSDRSRSRPEVGEKVKSRSRSSNKTKQHEPSIKKQKSDPTAKSLKKKTKKKGEDGKVKTKKVKQKHMKERGRSPTVKHKKTQPAGTVESPAELGKPGKIGSSSEARSSSSGSASGSSSRSRRSTSASSTSSSGSTNSSKTHTSISRSSGSSYEVEEGPEARKLVAMCIRKLPVRPTVTSLRDGIFHEFKKYGKVKSVLVRGDGADRHALVLFRTAAEASKAITHAKSKLLFGAAIEASIYDGEVSGQELEECGGIIDEFHPRASRTLFVGNLDKTVGYSDIQNIFVRFGEIVAIEIKKQHNIPQYAFLQYTDIGSVVRAITKMDGEKLGRNTLKLGFGKTVISSCLWVDGVTDSFTENYLASCFQRYGPVKHVVIDRNRGQALVFYAQFEFAQTAMTKMRARKLNGSRLKLDYASDELIEIFLQHMQSSGQSIQGLENIRQLSQPPSSPSSVPHQPGIGSSYNRSQDTRYYDDRAQSNYSEDQFISSDGNYRRGWRGRSRERYPYSSEQSSRMKRGYEDSYDRSEYHRDTVWEHDGYTEGNRRTSHYDQDYRQRDYDVRRDQRGYNRKQSRGNAPYDDAYHYRRDRPRDERDVERVRDRSGDQYYSRPGHLSPSHPRYLSRRSRSISPHTSQRDNERYSTEQGGGDTLYRRRGRSGSQSPDSQLDSIRRRNSMESKSSSHSGSRYTSRTGDVDMREYLEDDKISVASPRGDERIVEFSEEAKKLRVRKRVTADSPARDSDSSPRPQRHADYRSSRDKEGLAQHKPITGGTYDSGMWQSTSPSYSENRSRSGTPTRDENEDLIGEVIIKQPSKPRPTEKPRGRDDTKPHYDIERKDRSKPHDRDYRKGFTSSTETAKLDSGGKTKPIRSNSTSLIQRVHSPSDIERKSNVAYTKDFDYRKHAVVRSSKSSSEAASRHRSSKTSMQRHGDEHKRGRGQIDDNASNSPRSMSPSTERRGHGSSNLLKREYSPRPDEDEKQRPSKVHKSSERARPELERQKRVKENTRIARKSREEDAGEVDEKRSQKRRHSTEAGDDGEISVKRERKSSSSHHQAHQKHDAPMSIASQMFLQEDEESGMESPARSLKPTENAEEDVKSSKWEGEDQKKPTSAEESPTSEFAFASLAAAQSLLPKRLPKPVAPKDSKREEKEPDMQVKKEENDGNLTELEKEKERLQKLLSKLDSEKQLDVKDAEEVAGVVLQELTAKARSKLLASKPAKEDTETTKEANTSPQIPDSQKEVTATEEVVEQDGFSGELVTFEEEVVVDAIEEVTEDEVIETEEVEEVMVNEEEEEKVLEEKDDVPVSTQEISVAQQEIPVPVVPPAKVDEIDHTQGYRKQMEARKKEMEKLEKRREHERKKLLKKQEKEKKKQIKKVAAMRGPSQSVISSVDDEDEGGSKNEGDTPLDQVTTPLDGKTLPEFLENFEVTDQIQEDDSASENLVDSKSDDLAKNDQESSAKEDVQVKPVDVSETDTQTVDAVQDTASSTSQQNAQNLDLEKPWPPDRGKSCPDPPKTSGPKEETDATPDDALIAEKEIKEKGAESGTSKPSSVKTSSPLTPSSTERSTPLVSTPHAPGKEPSPKSVGQGATPTGSLTSSVSQKSSAATPTSVTPSQATRTPSFTTPSPASSSSTSSSKSQQRQKQMKNSSAHQHHKHPGHAAHQQKRQNQHGRPDHHSRPRGSSGADHKRRPSSSHQQFHRSSSSGGQSSRPRPEGHKKPVVPISRRPMATITVGLDASPSKPLGKTELERLRIELESVRNQLDMDNMSPSSLSPCSDDENTVGKSPAQLLSPVSPVMRSPAEPALKRSDSASPALQQSGSSSLTDRLKLLGRVKKKTPGGTAAVKVEPVPSLVVKNNEETVQRQSKVFRSSIFDQDSERLSHVCRQLENDNNCEGGETTMPVAAVVPLFSGSKFLEPSVFPIPNKSLVAPSANSSISVSAATAPAAVDGFAMSDQPQLSSIAGPKNVLSLSSSDLPATAERRLYDFAGKNCNTNYTNKINHSVEGMASTSTNQHESQELEKLASSVVVNTTPASVGAEPLASFDAKLTTHDKELDTREPKLPEACPTITNIPAIVTANMSVAPVNPNGIVESEVDHLQEAESQSNLKTEEFLDPQEQKDDNKSSETDTVAPLEDNKYVSTDEIVEDDSVPCSAPRDYMEEVVCDMDVYAGSCMEIGDDAAMPEMELAGTAVEVSTADMEIKLEENEVTLLQDQSNIAESEIDNAVRNQKPTETSEPAGIALEDSGKKVEIISIAPEKDPDTSEFDSDKNKSKVTATANESSTIVEPEKSDLAEEQKNPTIETIDSNEHKGKSDEKQSKKPPEKQETLRESKKPKISGKHKLGSKDSKPSGKESLTKKDGTKKTKHDDGKKKSGDLKPSSSKYVKSSSDKKEVGKSKSNAEKSGVAKILFVKQETVDVKKDVNPTSDSHASSATVLGDKNDTKTSKSTDLEPKKIVQKPTEKDHPSSSKAKDKEVTKEKKPHKEGKKDKKLAEKKPDSKSETKKLKKKEKHGEISAGMMPGNDSSKVPKDTGLGTSEEKNESEKAAVKDESKIKASENTGSDNTKATPNISNSEVKDSNPTTAPAKKKKKKKHASEKEKKPDKGTELKSSQAEPNAPVPESKPQRPEELKKTSELPLDKAKKSSKLHSDKSKVTGTNSSSTATKEAAQSDQSKTKKGGKKEESSSKSSKKDSSKKLSKSHLDLKVSHSALGKTPKKDDGNPPSKMDVSKKLLHKKTEKAASASPASKKSRYSMIYSTTDESSSESEDDVKLATKKQSSKPTTSDVLPKEKEEERQKLALKSKDKTGQGVSSSSQWPDLDEVQRPPVERHWSSSSSSSISDSTVPPPVVSSSLLVTETIKSETILPPGFDTHGFTDSSDDDNIGNVDNEDTKTSKDSSKSAAKVVESKKKKKLSTKPETAKKFNRKKGGEKPSSRRLIICSSDNDSSDGELMISMSSTDTSDVSDREDDFAKTKSTKAATKSADERKKAPEKLDDALFGSDYTSSDLDEDFSKPLQIDESRTEEKSEKKKLSILKTTSKTQEKKHSDSKVSKQTMKSADKRKKAPPKTDETLFGSDYSSTSSDFDEDFSKPLQIDESETEDKSEKKKPKIPSKTQEKKRSDSKVSKQTAKSKIESESSANELATPVKDKKKKKGKGDKEPFKKKKTSETSDAKPSKTGKFQSIENPPKKVQAKDKPKSDSDLFMDSDLDTSEIPEKMPKLSKDPLTNLKKNPSKTKDSSQASSSSGKSQLEKTKSDSKAMKSSQKGHDKKEKFKSKSHSLEKPPSQPHSKKSKESFTKQTVKPATETTHTHAERQRSSSKDKSQGEKDAPNSVGVVKETKTSQTKKEHPHKSKPSKISTPPVEAISEKESKTQQKESPDIAAHKHLKKLSKEGKKGENKDQTGDATVGSVKDRKLEKEKAKSDSKSHQPSTKQDSHKHGKKKKLKKTHKKETKDGDKSELLKKMQEKPAKKELPTSSAPKIPFSDKEKKEQSHSLLSSGSEDDSDFELVEDTPQEGLAEIGGKLSDPEVTKSPRKHINIEKLSENSSAAFSAEKGRNPTHGSPHKPKLSATARRQNLLQSSSLKVDEKRRGSAESFLTTSTTDDSDIEQRMAVQSAISSLDQDDDMEMTSTPSNVKSEPKDHESEGKQTFKSTEIKEEKIESQLPAFVTKPKSEAPAVSPVKKPEVRESREKKKKPHKGKDIKKESRTHPSSSSKVSQSGYPRSKHGLHYGTKESREDMDKIKSHERDEEAVRSIMGAFDESSDGDSYFSDVRTDEGTSSGAGGKNSEVERPHHLSRGDSDASSGFGRQTQPEIKEDTKSDVATSDPSANVKSEKQDEVAESRSTAEENELAAAVSSIEGLFGDFGDKQSEYVADYSSATSSASFSDQRVKSDKQPEQKEPMAPQEQELSQEEVERGCEEAALAASTLLAESSEEDSTFYGFRNPAISGHSKGDEKFLKETKKPAHTETSVDLELPSIRSEHPSPSSASNILPSAESKATDASGSRKRPWQSRGRGTSPRMPSKESKSDASDASMSESDSVLNEPGGRTPGQKPSKQRKISKGATPISQQPTMSNQYDFDDSNTPLSLPKPETADENLPFVYMPKSAQQSGTLSALPAAPFVDVSSSPAPVTVTTTSVDVSPISSIKPPAVVPTQQSRRTSRDSDAGSVTGGTVKRRSSSSSSSAVSPTRGSQMPQLTPTSLNAFRSFGGGVQISESSVYPFRPHPEFSVPQTHAEFSLSPSIHVSPTQPREVAPAPVPSSVQHNPHRTPGQYQAYHPHMPPQVQPTYSVRPVPSTAHPIPGGPPNVSYPHSSFSGATNPQSMPGQANMKLPMLNTGPQQLASKSNVPLVAPVSFPIVSSASVTSSAPYQSQFVHQHPSGLAGTQKTPETSQPPVQYHIGVPTYQQHAAPQQQPAVPPQQSPQRAPAPHHEPPATQPEPIQKPLTRPQFSHQMLPGGPQGYPHMFSLPGQALSQPAYGLPSPTRPLSVQILPLASVPSTVSSTMPQSQESIRQRTPSNPYLAQQNIPQPPQGAPTPVRPAAPPQTKPLDVPQGTHIQPVAGKSESQRPESSAPNASQPTTIPGLPQVSPQTIYRKIEHSQPHLGAPQPGVPPQAILPHPLYYPGLQPFPGLAPGLPYMSLYGLRPGMPQVPVSVVHPSDIPRHAQQRLQMPQQRITMDKPQSQTYGSLPQTPARKEQQMPTPATKASPTVRDAPHPIHHQFGMPQAVSQPHMQAMPQLPPPHEAYAAVSTAAPTSHRPDQVDRVVRVPSEKDQQEMVEQHFRMSGIATTPPRSHPPPSTAPAPPVAEKPKFATPSKQDLAVNPSLTPALYPQQVLARPYGLGLPNYGLPPGMRLPDQHMWPRPSANFRPPSVPMAAGQLSQYAPVSSGTHPAPAATYPQLRMPTGQPHPQVAPPQATPSPSTTPKPETQVMDLFQRYPVIWQGLLALKNESAAVQTHFICGDRALAQAYLPRPDAQSETDKERNLAVLRIVQRMRLEPPQLEGIDKKMMEGTDFCVLLALPCGRDESDVIRQQNALKQGFIDYLKQKQAAGIVNVPQQHAQSQLQYVLHVFPPCEFTTKHLQRNAQDLLSNINDIQHIMIVIAAV